MRGGVFDIALLPSCCQKLAPHPACGHLPPQGGRLSPKGFPLGGSCRPQAADEGLPCLYCPVTGLPPETRPSSGLRPPSPAGGRLSPKGFPLGGSCRPQAADEGQPCLYCPVTGLPPETRPSSGLGRSLGHLPPRGKAPYYLLICPRRMFQKLPQWSIPSRSPLSNRTMPAARPSNTPPLHPVRNRLF